MRLVVCAFDKLRRGANVLESLRSQVNDSIIKLTSLVDIASSTTLNPYVHIRNVISAGSCSIGSMSAYSTLPDANALFSRGIYANPNGE